MSVCYDSPAKASKSTGLNLVFVCIFYAATQGQIIRVGYFPIFILQVVTILSLSLPSPLPLFQLPLSPPAFRNWKLHVLLPTCGMNELPSFVKTAASKNSTDVYRNSNNGSFSISSNYSNSYSNNNSNSSVLHPPHQSSLTLPRILMCTAQEAAMRVPSGPSSMSSSQYLCFVLAWACPILFCDQQDHGVIDSR